MRSVIPLFRRLGRVESGTAALEFAIVAPVFLAFLMGALEFGFQSYVRNRLDGTMAKAARDVTLESANDVANRALLDARVARQIRNAFPLVDVTFTRKAYHDYKSVAAPMEPFVDHNHNGRCDSGEAFQDNNDNGRHDMDGGAADWGEADDAVLYTATAKFKRFLPVAGILGLSDDVTVTSTKMLRIQPFAGRKAPEMGTCS